MGQITEVVLTLPSKTFDSYVPRVASEWDSHAKESLWRSVKGTLLFVDISGFTNLSERLARKGRIGAEELTSVLNRVFGQMLDIVYERGGSLLKFGGDALLLLFQTSDHVMQATAAAVEMRAALREASREPTSVGRINLKMSSGIHTGPVDFFLVGESHRELIVTGPTASITTEMEGTADANEIVVSDQAAQILPTDYSGDRKGDGWLLRKQKIHHPICGLITRDEIPAEEMAEFVSSGLRTHLAAGVTEPEHRISTIGFVKFKGIDKLLEELGPVDVGHALDELVTVVQRAADGEGITFLASDIDADGGKLILSAGVPTSQADDEGRMLRAAREILDANTVLGVRIGVNRGHVFSGEVGNAFRRTYTVMGDTVNLAARLMAAADTGMLYASPGVLDRSSTLFRTEVLEPFHVKGKEKPVQAYAVHEEIGIRPPELEQGLPFHGREAERDMIVGIITTCARSGRGGMMTITGDTGLGKTRLISEILAECPGLDTLMIQAEPNGADNPYWAFRDPLRRLLGVERAEQSVMVSELEAAMEERAAKLAWAVPLLGDVMHIEVPENDQTSPIDPRFRPDRTADVVIQLLETIHPGPFAAIGEDGHWMDEASIALLRRIGEAASRRPWTVIFTARKERSDFEPLGDEVPLRPLDDDAVRAIVIEATAAAPLRPHELDAVVARAGGNPLFLSEILNMIRDTGSAEELPESLDAVVSSEIDTLPILTRQLLRYASVLGRSFPRLVLNEILAPEELELDKATEEELGRFLDADGDTRLRFRHAVVHDVAYQGLSYRRRRELHARAAGIVERLNSNDPDAVAEFLAFHYAESGNWAKVWHYARAAGDRAKRAYANTEAASHYRKAIDAARNLDDVEDLEVAETWKQLGIVRDFTGQFENARDAYLQALRLDGRHPEQAVDLRIRRADAWLNSGRYSQAKRELSLGAKNLEGLDKSESTGLEARLASVEAKVLFRAGRLKVASDTAKRAIELARKSKEEQALARAYLVLDGANFMLGVAPPKYGDTVVDIYRRLGLLERSAVAMNNMGAFAYWRGDWDESVKCYEQSVEDSERAGNVIEAANTRASIAEVLISQRRFSEAAPLIDDAHRVIHASNALQLVPFVELQQARLEMEVGDPERALDLLRSMFEEQMGGRRTDWTAVTALAYAEALLRSNQALDALQVLDHLVERAPDLVDDAAQVDIHRLEGLAMARQGATEEAEDRFDQGLRIARDAEALYEELLVREARSATRDRAGISPDPVDVERTDRLRRQLGVKAPEPIEALSA